MKTKDYNMKMSDHLESRSYRKLQDNPMRKIIKKITSTINISSMDDDLKKRIIPKDIVLPRVYRLPKIHKTDNPLRLIVNTIGSPTYALEKYLSKQLKPLIGNGFSFIKDSTDIVEMMKHWKMCENDTLISFDIVSLYTMVPIDKAIDVVKEVVNEEIANLVEICLRSTIFVFRGEIYEQTEGVTMGSPLSPVVTNLFMEHLEKK